MRRRNRVVEAAAAAALAGVMLLAAGSAAGAQTTARSNAVADSLFQHARTADSPVDARRDYLRIIVDFSLSPRAEEALLRLGEMEYDSGDKTAARRHLERLSTEHPDGATRSHGAYWLARVLLDAGESRAACDLLTEAKAKAKSSDVEFLGQVTYYAQPCTRIQAAAAAAAAAAAQALADSTARADSVARAAARADSLDKVKGSKKGSAKRGAAKDTYSGPAWSAQVAAFASEADADKLAAKLTKRGYDARVTAAKPYRVRIGRFHSRAEAVELVQKLRDAKMTAIVVEAERP
jgi:cell division septation protein DedD